MRIVFLTLLTFIILISRPFSQEYEGLLLEANKNYESGNKEVAKNLYIKASELGSAEAHFTIAFKYIIPEKEQIYHYSEAARRGHEEALGYALDHLLFRANKLKTSDPQQALDIYLEAKQNNPSLSFYDEDNTVRIMKMCVEPKGFDADKFIEKYDVKDEDGEYPFYDVWELAEEASKGGRFGKPNPELVLNLVIRGSHVPAELESALEETYNNWKNNVVKEFNICDHITSGMGGSYCASRDDAATKKARDMVLEKLKTKLPKGTESLLNNAYESAIKFIELKAECEEGHGGSSRAAWITESEIKQKNHYIRLIEKISEGFKPVPKSQFIASDKQLNEVYKKVMRKLKAESENYAALDPDDIRSVQRLWIPYRDASVELFVKLNPSIDKNLWKSWLTEIRVAELISILGQDNE